MTSKSGTHGLHSLMGIVDRRLGQSWQLEALAVGLAFHLLSFKAFGQGLLDASPAPLVALTGPNAAVALAAIVISTCLLPTLGTGLIWTLERLEVLVGVCRDPLGRSARLDSGWVRISQARDAALLDRDAFWCARVDRELSVRDRKQSERRRQHSRSFAALFLLAIDLACPRSLAVGVVQLVTGIDFAGELLGVTYLASSLRWCMAVLEDSPTALGMIYHPTLARQLGAKAKHFGRPARSR